MNVIVRALRNDFRRKHVHSSAPRSERVKEITRFYAYMIIIKLEMHFQSHWVIWHRSQFWESERAHSDHCPACALLTYSRMIYRIACCSKCYFFRSGLLFWCTILWTFFSARGACNKWEEKNDESHRNAFALALAGRDTYNADEKGES